MVGQDKQTISNAARHKNPAGLYFELQQDIFVSNIIIVAGQDFCRIGFFELGQVGYVIAVIIQNIGNKFALLHKKMAAVYVVYESIGIFPPCDLRIDVRTCKILLARDSHFLWRARECMKENHIQTGAEFMIHTGLL